MTTLNLTQENNSGQNNISINIREKPLNELIRLFRKNQNNHKELINTEKYTENFESHILKNTKTKKLQNSDFSDTHIDEFYVPLVITPDIRSLRNLRSKSLSNLTDTFAKQKTTISGSNLKIAEIEYLKFKASQQPQKHSKQNKTIITECLEETKIDENFVIENYFKEIGENIINIQAGAGHGKTTILKKILLNQFKKGTKNPIFIDLKSVESNFAETLLQVFNEIIPELDINDVFQILDSGNVILILDAFDEINQNTVDTHKVIEEIISITTKFKTPALISSRPNSTLLKTGGICILGIKDLNNDQLLKIFIKSKKQDSFNIQLLQDFLKNPAREAIRTPLLANLFIKTFPQLTSFPENSRDFYKKIFDLLYSGHDSFKEGKQIKRKLHDILSMEKSKEYFALLSIITLASNTDNVSCEKYAAQLEEAINFFEISDQYNNGNFSKNFISSIIDCTSLLIDTGGAGEETTYTFLHKSIQEYYSADFFRTNIYDGSSDIFNDELLSAIVNSISNDNSQYIDFLKNLFYSNKKIYLINIVRPIIELMNSKNENNELKKYLLNKLISNIDIKAISETELVETNEFKKTFKTTILIEIQNTRPELDSLLSALINILNEDEYQAFDKITGIISDEISKIIIKENQKAIDFKSIKKNNNKFLVRSYNSSDLQKSSIDDNAIISNKIEDLLTLFKNSYEQNTKKTSSKKKGFLDRIAG